MNLAVQLISHRYEVCLNEEQFKAVTKYNENLDTVRSNKRMLEYIVYDKTCATNTELFADLEGGYIFFTVAECDADLTEIESILRIIQKFVSEALDPEMYM